MEAPVMSQRGKKRTLEESRIDGNIGTDYIFKILFPNNGSSVGLTLRDPKPCMPLRGFIELVKAEYFRALMQSKSMNQKRKINWRSESMYVVDSYENEIKSVMDFEKFKPNKCHILRLYDGSSETTNTFENMWDLTPHTDLLMELPEEYTFETALADMIDNSLQAVWRNGECDKRLISVDIADDRISIFDTGPGMDGSEENSIVKWGKIGSSLHRASRRKAIGGKPPYLTPCFGMFGYGGPIASMHLGKRASVSSKTKMSTMVYTLHLEKEALLACSDSQLKWRTTGDIRAPSKEEIKKSPHKSFTKVEILEPKLKCSGIDQLQCKLKDIYFPYIQCDEVSKTGKTTTPIEFQVNNVDLAEIEGGEVAITNLHSCNGPEFVLQLRFSLKQDSSTTGSPGPRASQANARLKCLYFPVMEGIESIEKIIEKLKSEGYGVTENYETFSRVSIRQLGRLLLDARWPLLPFMDLRLKKGDKAHLLKRCCMRVKCMIDIDAGFYPTRSKTDLAPHNPFTTALKTFGARALKEENDMKVEVSRDGKSLTPLQLEKDYQEWLLQMHDQYDEEICSGEDQPILILNPTNKNALGIFSDVVRLHKVLKRKGKIWKSAQKIKIFKGACAGLHKNNVYATLEYFLIEGFQGDAGGEARVICRPINVSNENGCVLAMNDGMASLDIRSSLSVPISVIDSGKCVRMDNNDWNRQLETQHLKAPSMINLLNANECRDLEIDGALPFEAVAGKVPPREIVAVVRPGSFIHSSALKNLDQKYIVKDKLEMAMEIKFRGEARALQNFQDSYPHRVSPSDHKGFQGLYIFPLGCKYPHLFQIAGQYTFSFYLISDAKIESSCKICEKQVLVKESSKIGKWSLSSSKQSSYSIKVGSFFPPVSIICHDIYGNRTSFASIPSVKIKLKYGKILLLQEDDLKTSLSTDKLILTVEDILIESNKLDKIRPHYKATLLISSLDESMVVSIPCQVTPGSPNTIIAQPSNWVNYLCSGSVVDKLKLEAFDAYGNHVKKGLEVELILDGFCFEDQTILKYKVDNYGCMDLGGRLKVTAGHGKNVSLSVLYHRKVLFKQEFQTEKRVLRVVSGVPECCTAGSQLENVIFEIVDSEGYVDETIHDDKGGQSHTLTIKSELISMEDSVRYAFRQGRCTVPAILVPPNEGCFCFEAVHSRFPELCLNIKVPIIRAPRMESEVETPSSSGMMSIMKKEEEIGDGICKYGLKIGKFEAALKSLNDGKEEIEQVLSGLQASIGPNMLTDPSCSLSKEEMIRRIESKGQAAAAALCSFTREHTLQKRLDFMEDIVGLVALIGTVCTNKLSRILAEYIGEDHMLALVMRSFEAAQTLENYDQNGEVDHMDALHKKAAALGKPIVGRFSVICLDDIRPYMGKIEDSDPQRWLDLPPPTSPTGPPGFFGYAVNMVNLDDQHIRTRTTSGYGLRETLLYRLFGELQVYGTREDMIEARAYIKHGAVSLDGGILKENGIISLGHGNPEICFPVTSSGVEMPMSPESLEKLKQIEEKKLVYAKITDAIERYSKRREKAIQKFKKRKDEFDKLLDGDQPVMKDNLLEYKSDVKK